MGDCGSVSKIRNRRLTARLDREKEKRRNTRSEQVFRKEERGSISGKNRHY